jgi:multidrug resistance efflux pump
VEENDPVMAGEPVLRLEGKEDLQAAAATARLEIASAQYDLDQLYKDLDLRLARAEQVLVDARQTLKDAERHEYNVALAAEQADVDQARANLVLARDRMEKAREDFEPYENKPEDNLTRAALLSVKAQAEDQYDQAVRTLNNLLAGANELDVDEASAERSLAQAQLAVAEREVQTLKNGPDPKDVKLAEERLANAKAQLLAAEAAVSDLELMSPFDGTVSVLYVKQSEWIAPGQPVLLLADLSHLRVETTDLNEIDVARVDVGDTAIVTFDALPGVSVKGKVVRIAPKSSQGSGVNYTVVVELDEIPAKLRWGMTAFADIEVQE